MRLVLLRDEDLQKAGVSYRASTLKRYHHIGLLPKGVVVNVGGRKLFVNLDELAKWMAKRIK